MNSTLEEKVQKQGIELEKREEIKEPLPQRERPPTYDKKKIGTDGSKIDIVTKIPLLITVYVHSKSRSIDKIMKEAPNHVSYTFESIPVEELNKYSLMAIPIKPDNSQKLPPEMFQHCFSYTEAKKEIIYEAIKEFHRSFR
jgi:hypothetical protein